MSNSLPSAYSVPGCAVITGAASGIGQAVSVALAIAGCRSISLLDINVEGLDKTKELISTALKERSLASIKLAGIHCDVTSVDSITAAFTEAHTTMSRIDYLVNCAGVTLFTGPSSTAPIEDFDRQNAINYRGLWLCSRTALAIMAGQTLDSEAYPAAKIPASRAQRGSIVNMASCMARLSMAGIPVYCATKGAVCALTRSDAVDNAPQRIRVNAVLPGIIETPILHPSPEIYGMLHQVVIPNVPLGRIGEAEEVADLVVFLAGNSGSYATGADFVIDGGWTCHA